MTAGRWAAAVIVIAIAGAVAAGLSVIESPTQARVRRLDVRRANDLHQLARDVDVFRARRGRLPSTLEDLSGERSLGMRQRDPEHAALYEYRPIDDWQFELCATFGAESGVAPTGVDRQFWSHGGGRQCFVVRAREPG